MVLMTFIPIFFIIIPFHDAIKPLHSGLYSSDNINDATVMQASLVGSTFGPSICRIGEEDCVSPLRILHSYMEHVLNAERHFISKGNSKRNPVATDMLRLKIDPELLSEAQKHAETCLKPPNFETCDPPDEETVEGDVRIFVREYDRNINESAESRVASVLMKGTSHSPNISQEMVKSFSPSDVENFDKNAVPIFHAKVWKLGCGIADFLTPPDKFKEVIVCFYGAPKFKPGEKLYTAGCVPCSNCPSGTSCIEQGVFVNSLCQILPDQVPIFSSWEKEENKKICYEPRAPAPTPSPRRKMEEEIIWSNTKNSSIQACVGRNPCSSGWQYDGRTMKIEVQGQCACAAAFHRSTPIAQPSCFSFRYFLHFGKDLENFEIIVAAFAFSTNNQGKNEPLEIEKQYITKNNYLEDQKMYLDIPRTGPRVYVGFGTQSKSDKYMYEIKAVDFKISSGTCHRGNTKNV